MQKSQIDVITLVVATLAAALALTQIAGPLAWLSSAGGIILLFVLFSFDQEGYRNVFQSLAFSAVCGFCTAVACGAVFQLLANHGEVHLGNNQWATEYMPLTCAFATAAFWAIDLMRMNARKIAPIQVPRALGETRIFSEPAAPVTSPAAAAYYQQPNAAYSQSTPGYQQPPVAYQPPVAPPIQHAPPPPVQPQPVYRAPVETAPPPPPVTAAPAPQPVESVPDIPTATSFFAVPGALNEPESAPPTQPVNPASTPVYSQSGKEAMIYVTLLGEGLNLLRSVRAEPLGRDYYRIIEQMPEGETWQFQPGQVVRCKKKTLSSGKAMVAMEEAPRST